MQSKKIEYIFCLYLKISLKMIKCLKTNFCYLNIIYNLEQITNTYEDKYLLPLFFIKDLFIEQFSQDIKLSKS